MSTRTETFTVCDVCATERKSDGYSSNGFTLVKLDGEEHHIRGGHACSKDCLGVLLARMAQNLTGTRQ